MLLYESLDGDLVVEIGEADTVEEVGDLVVEDDVVGGAVGVGHFVVRMQASC